MKNLFRRTTFSIMLGAVTMLPNSESSAAAAAAAATGSSELQTIQATIGGQIHSFFILNPDKMGLFEQSASTTKKALPEEMRFCCSTMRPIDADRLPFEVHVRNTLQEPLDKGGLRLERTTMASQDLDKCTSLQETRSFYNNYLAQEDTKTQIEKEAQEAGKTSTVRKQELLGLFEEKMAPHFSTNAATDFSPYTSPDLLWAIDAKLVHLANYIAGIDIPKNTYPFKLTSSATTEHESHRSKLFDLACTTGVLQPRHPGLTFEVLKAGTDSERFSLALQATQAKNLVLGCGNFRRILVPGQAFNLTKAQYLKGLCGCCHKEHSDALTVSLAAAELPSLVANAKEEALYAAVPEKNMATITDESGVLLLFDKEKLNIPLLNQFHRILTSGGTLTMSTHSYNKLSDEMIASLEEKGFKKQQTVTDDHDMLTTSFVKMDQ